MEVCKTCTMVYQEPECPHCAASINWPFTCIDFGRHHTQCDVLGHASLHLTDLPVYRIECPNLKMPRIELPDAVSWEHAKRLALIRVLPFLRKFVEALPPQNDRNDTDHCTKFLVKLIAWNDALPSN